MFPEPEPRQTIEAKSTAGTAREPAAEALESKDQSGIVKSARHENESVLRMSLALNVARSDEHDEQHPEPSSTPGTWIVKSLPRPPLVAAMLQEPPGEELLANDSLGG